jgi:hypothetical protein
MTSSIAGLAASMTGAAIGCLAAAAPALADRVIPSTTNDARDAAILVFIGLGALAVVGLAVLLLRHMAVSGSDRHMRVRFEKAESSNPPEERTGQAPRDTDGD